MKKLLWQLLSAVISLVALSAAQQPAFNTNQVELLVLPGFNHVPQTLGVSSNGAPYTGTLTVTSDSAWAKPTWDAANGQVSLTLVTSNFVASQTATIHIETATSTNEAFVHATVAALNVLKLVDDPSRSRVYGVHAYGTGIGSVFAIDPLTGQLLGNITVGKKPTDLAVAPATDELLVLNSVDKSVTVIDLASFTIKDTILLPEYGDWGPDSTAGNLQIGPGDIIYYTDGSWAPVLYAYNRATKQNIQKTGLNDLGFGDFALTSDKKTLIGWAQYGWSAGWAGSYIARFSVAADGTVTLRETTDTQYPTSIGRDPLDTPVLINNSDTEAFVKQKVVNTGLINPPTFSFPAPIYAISPGGEVACTSEGVYERSTGNRLMSIDGNPTAQIITSDYARLVYFKPTTKEFKFINLLEAIGGTVLGRQLSPADKAIVLAPAKLIWSPIPGVDSYRVFFGETRVAVENATTNFPEYLGTTSASEIALSRTMSAGHTYYWRVDAVSSRSEVTGVVYEFTVSGISSSVSLITGSTLQGYKSVVASFDVSSATVGSTWVAQGGQPWISFVQDTGVTPATIQVIVDASKLNVGITNSTVLVGPDTNSLIAIPLRVRVEPLSLTIIKSDPTSAFAYAISENTQDPTPHAYLLEIDTANELITRVVEVGSGVTDVAIHNPEGRVYVTNWRIGSLLAVNKETFKVERTYAFLPFQGTGYGEGDVYRISAGVKGRLVVEEEDQWIDISVFDTVAGTNKARVNVRQGGGGFDPTGRYYYHGEDNSSGATIQRYDMTGDAFNLLKSIRVESASYFGSRVVTISEDGSRVFWNGSAFDAALNEIWAFGEHIYSCTPDGRYAFALDKVYDIELRKVAFGTPVATTVSAFNSASKKLILQRDGRVDFFLFDLSAPLPKPVLTASSITSSGAVLTWTDKSLETTFTVQSRIEGATEWTDLATPGQNVNQLTVTLQPETHYQFRVKATSPVTSSDWSDILAVNTPGLPPSGLALNPPLVSSSLVRLSWTDPANETALILQRHGSNEVGWSTLSMFPANTTTYNDSAVTSGEVYTYRITASNVWSTIFAEATVTVPFPAPPAAPQLVSLTALSGLGVRVAWNISAEASSYDVERTTDGAAAWTKIATVDGAVTTFEDRQVEPQREYVYRVIAVNSVGRSDPSQTMSIIVQRIGCVVGDDFEMGLDPGTWQLVQAGQVIGNTNGLLDGKALWFGDSGTRLATTLPMNLSGGATLHFNLRAGNPADGTNVWDPSELGEGIVLEYSTNGTRWATLATYDTTFPKFSTWQAISTPLPFYVWSETTQIRWRQVRNSGAGADTWAIDNVCVEGPLPPPPAQPPFLMATSNSSHSMALWWAGVANAREYVIERAASGGGWLALASVGGNQTWFTDLACTPSTTYAYRLKAVNSSGDSTYSATAFGTTISQLVEWQVENLGSTSQPITTVGSDGISMVARYAFNLPATGPTPTIDPTNPTGGLPLITYNDATDCLEVTFIRRKAEFDPGVAYEVQFSDDLTTWVGSGNEIAVSSVADAWEVARFADTLEPRRYRFCRVAIRLLP